MAKVINLKAKDDITSVIELLWETGEEEVYLVATKDPALLKNIIAMKLLKREADRLGKEIILITKDAVARETAKRVGITSKVALPKNELEEEQEVFREMAPEKFESMIEGQVKIRREGNLSPRQFSDIRPKEATIKHHFVETEEDEEKIILPVSSSEQEPSPFLSSEKDGGKEEPPSFLEKLINKDNSLADDYFAVDKIEDEEEERELAEEAEGEPEESADDAKEREEDFPIHGLAGGARRISVKESKSFFDRLPSLNFRKIKESLKVEEVERRSKKKSLAVPFFSGKFLALFGGAAVLVALLTLYFILSKAEVAIVPKTEAISQSLIVIADKGSSKIDFTQNKILAQLIKLDKRQSQEFTATGQRQVNDKAKGIITVYNEYSSSPQPLVEKTRFVSEGGQTFRLIKTTTVPGAQILEGKIVGSSIDVDVVADQPGGEYNIGPGRFTIPGFQGTPKYNAFYGQSKSAMAGGASGLLKVVTQEDYNKAKNELWQSLQPALDSEFKNQLPSGLKIIDGAQKEEITGVDSTVTVGSPADKFTMTIKGAATVVLFDEKDILEIIRKKLADKLNNNDLSLVTDKIDYQLTSVDYARGQITAKVSVSGKLVWKINTDDLKKEISGQNEKGIRDIFSRHSEVSEVKVSFWPFWVKNVPNNLDKVIIKVSE